MAAGFLQRERIVAPPTWSRWLVPPAALSIHLAIGQAYAWSVFKPPLEKGLHISGVASALPFTFGIIMLGLSAAVFGTKVDANGPRWAMAVASACFVSGFLISALGLFIGWYPLVVIGYGVVGGIGLGIGYISPVSTLIKWFPDRPGLATGMAIMGFGGGALVASPLSRQLLSAYDAGYDPGSATSTASGHALTMLFVTLGIAYFAVMMLGVANVRVPAPGWVPAGFDPSSVKTKPMVTTASVSAANAIRTPQFWLMWIVLFCNVTAGIGILDRK